MLKHIHSRYQRHHSTQMNHSSVLWHSSIFKILYLDESLKHDNPKRNWQASEIDPQHTKTSA